MQKIMGMEAHKHLQYLDEINKLLQIKEEELAQANNKLEMNKHRLDVSNKKRALLTEFSETLITCKNQDEMLIVILSYVSKILDFSKGILYLFDLSHKYLEKTTSWGNPNKYEQIIIPEECWAIRRGFLHETNLSAPAIPCSHIKNPKQDFSYICAPVSAQNEIFGSLYIEIENYDDALLIEYHLLINMVSKTIALAIANINLRNLLRDQSIRDALTGLYNRRFLDEFLIKQIGYAKRQKNNLAIIMFDLDNFKKINDTYGHEAGDIILEKLGHLMTSITRAEDAVCRYGGEEFICILQNCSLVLAKKRAEEFRQKIQQMTPGALLPSVTISLGISAYPTDGQSPNELIEKADKALYESKKTGKNKITTYADIHTHSTCR
jgi:diguanylate cyclase (GGDEF)-like protein